MRGRFAGFLAGVTVTALLGAASVAAAIGIPDSSGVIHACYSSDKGALRVVASESQCRKDEIALNWNQRGPQGERGLQGPQGLPGTQGPQGDKGDQGLRGSMGEQGPQGIQGEEGPVGPQGEQGEPGTPADLAALEDLTARVAALETALEALTGGVDPPDDIRPYGSEVGECVQGLMNFTTGEVLIPEVGPSTELVDGLDNDCDGSTDEGLDDPNDEDADGVPNDLDNCLTIANPDQQSTIWPGLGDACIHQMGSDVGECETGLIDLTSGQLLRPQTFPAPEVENGLDDDCDGAVDETGASPTDTDGDGVLDVADNCPLTSNADQSSTIWPPFGDACVRITGTDVGQCETRIEALTSENIWITVRPGTGPWPELPDGADNDCDGVVDNGLDADGDGVLDVADNCPQVSNPSQRSTIWPPYGDACVVVTGTDVGQCITTVEVLTPDNNWVTVRQGIGPRAEQLNGLDDDCDGVIDNGF